MSEPTEAAAADNQALSLTRTAGSVDGAYPLFTMFDLLSAPGSGPVEERTRRHRAKRHNPDCRR